MTVDKLKRLVFGEPFRTSQEHHERLDKVRGLAIFASDPISSNAYATEAIMAVLLVLGSSALGMTWAIALAIALLVLIVVFSYIQTILHYPDGGGAYTVAKDNLGTTPSLLAAAALLTDYVLTVSVSVSAGMRAITSAFPELHGFRIVFALTAILILTWMNLRGVRESGTVFALPTYAFVGGVLLMVLVGLARYYGLFGLERIVPEAHPLAAASSLTTFAYIWLILRAFAAGCTALTGIEAISNGVGAFKKPESRNAAQTMVVMAVMAMALFLGISFLATHLNLVPSHTDSILSQLARTVSGSGLLYYWVQFFTMMILILAANTGYQDFPRLSSFLAKDGFMPRWMTNRGDRLVFNGGILTLALVAAVIVIIFRADEIAMLPLYALGVMLSFTLSQAGMVRLMGKISKLKPGESLKTLATTVHHESGWWWKQLVNAFGSLVTLVVFLVLVATKFLEGAWAIALAIPLLVWLFRSIHKHYEDVAETLRTRHLDESNLLEVADVVILPMGDVHRGTLRALRYAKRISSNVRAVCVITSAEQKERLVRRWNRFPKTTEGVSLVCIDYDYRDVLDPLIEYIEHVNKVEFPSELTSVVIPEFITESVLTQILHNQTANILRARLRQYKDIVVIDIPIHINGSDHPPHDSRDKDPYTTEIISE
ncbi:MAG: APC family permease [Chloroflexi bacterium]|nr:APC family permease [Chloroflexota bacterium]